MNLDGLEGQYSAKTLLRENTLKGGVPRDRA